MKINIYFYSPWSQGDGVIMVNYGIGYEFEGKKVVYCAGGWCDEKLSALPTGLSQYINNKFKAEMRSHVESGSERRRTKKVVERIISLFPVIADELGTFEKIAPAEIKRVMQKGKYKPVRKFYTGHVLNKLAYDTKVLANFLGIGTDFMDAYHEKLNEDDNPLREGHLSNLETANYKRKKKINDDPKFVKQMKKALRENAERSRKIRHDKAYERMMSLEKKMIIPLYGHVKFMEFGYVPELFEIMKFDYITSGGKARKLYENYYKKFKNPLNVLRRDVSKLRKLRKTGPCTGKRMHFFYDGEKFKYENGEWYRLDETIAPDKIQSELYVKYGNYLGKKIKSAKIALAEKMSRIIKRRRMLYKFILRENNGKITGVLPSEVSRMLKENPKYANLLGEYRGSDMEQQVYGDMLVLAEKKGIKLKLHEVFVSKTREEESSIRIMKLNALEMANETKKELWENNPEWREGMISKLRGNISKAVEKCEKNKNYLQRLELLAGHLTEPVFMRFTLNGEKGDKKILMGIIASRYHDLYSHYENLKNPHKTFWDDLNVLEYSEIMDILENGFTDWRTGFDISPNGKFNNSFKLRKKGESGKKDN